MGIRGMSRFWLLLCPLVIASAATPEWERAYSLVQKADFQQAVSVLEKARTRILIICNFSVKPG